MNTEVKNLSVPKLAVPIFFQMLFSICLGYIDTAMMSHYSETAVGALGNANQILGFLSLAFLVISSATGVIVAQYLGAGKKDSEMNLIYTVAVSFNFCISIIISVVVTLFSGSLLHFVNIPQEMFSYSKDYMQIVCFFLFADSIINVFSQIFNCKGKTQIGMIISFSMNIINMIGNFLFLYGPLTFLNMGIKGVAISTSVSRCIGLITSFICFKKFIHGSLSFKYLKPFPKDILLKLLKLGIPTAGEKFSYSISQILITVVVNTLGSVAITTKIYCNMLCLFSMIFSNSVAGATSIITGHSVGANDYDYAYKKVNKSLLISMIISICVAFLNFTFINFTITLFTKDEQIISLAKTIMLIGIFLEIGRCANLVIIQSLRASGDVLFPTILGIFSMWGISVLFSWILGLKLNMGLTGVWIAMASDELFRGIVVFFRWQKGSWRGKRLVNS